MDAELFQISFTKKQLRVLESALNLVTRLGLGQIDCVGEFLDHHANRKKNPNFPSYWDMRNDVFDPLKKKLFGFEGGASYGVGNPEVHDDSHIAYDIQKTIQKTIATEEKHESHSVWHNGDILHYGSEPRIKITKVPNYDYPKFGIRNCEKCKKLDCRYFGKKRKPICPHYPIKGKLPDAKAVEEVYAKNDGHGNGEFDQ